MRFPRQKARCLNGPSCLSGPAAKAGSRSSWRSRHGAIWAAWAFGFGCCEAPDGAGFFYPIWQRRPWEHWRPVFGWGYSNMVSRVPWAHPAKTAMVEELHIAVFSFFGFQRDACPMGEYHPFFFSDISFAHQEKIGEEGPQWSWPPTGIPADNCLDSG